MRILPALPALPVLPVLPVLLLTLACTAGTTRPTYRPFPRAGMDTLAGNPAVIVEAARAGAEELGMRVHSFSSTEGYLETRWFDVGNKQSHRANTSLDRQVRLRVWTDLVTPSETQVAVEVVYRRSADPSVPEREIEVVADSGTAGDSLARALRDAVRKKFVTRD